MDATNGTNTCAALQGRLRQLFVHGDDRVYHHFAVVPGHARVAARHKALPQGALAGLLPLQLRHGQQRAVGDADVPGAPRERESRAALEDRPPGQGLAGSKGPWNKAHGFPKYDYKKPYSKGKNGS
ncbi:hypothetical protein OCS_05391 [Ophiocordyceps sinensis CO18]|uniref:Uncharacterized protein n=1 Tax=Ophiocordyceps sinensis (strain Co18 / CGMCC 3.14243) TaxID=911162 RepID=T5A8I3_OPHSC|nr:hypothetical protein OCS_05391 [Ophiocordyceps sinensis CO18]